MKFRKTLVFLLILVINFVILPASKSDIQPQTGSAEITAINIEEANNNTEILIDSNFPISSYTIYKPEDPYKVVVELQGVTPGKFKDKMVFDKAGVMEITPSSVPGDVEMVRLDIILTVPADIKPLRRGNALVLTFYNPEAEDVIASQEEPEVVAEKEEQPVSEETGIIENLEFIKSADRIDVLISGNVTMSPKVSEVEGNKLVIDIPGVSTDIESYEAVELPVLGIRIGKQADRTRIVFDLIEATKYNVSSEDEQIRVSFEMPVVKVAKTVNSSVEEALPEVTVENTKPEPFTTKGYTGEKISIDFQDADLKHIFRLIAEVSGYNIVLSPQVQGRFTMKLTDIPWDHALDVILRNYGLSKTVKGKIIRIAPTIVIAKEEEEIARAKEAQLKAGDLETRTYKINYADVRKVQKVIKDAKIVSQRGYFSIDERTSSIIVKDVPKMHKEIEKLIESLDLPTPQVSIEAKIVEVTTSFTKEFGIQWGTLWSPPDSRTTIGGPSIPGGTGFSSGNPLMVNLPATVASGKGGAIGIGYISASNVFTLDLQLSAMEETANGRIISNPKIVTIDNQEATIKQGQRIPYQTKSANEGTKIEFIDAEIELTVTPHITPEGTIVMNLQARKNEVGAEVTAGTIIETKEIKTQVLVRNGDTLVLGGIFKTTIRKSLAGVPGLSKIPILGWLFKKKKDTEEKTELLFFITPRIVKDL